MMIHFGCQSQIDRAQRLGVFSDRWGQRDRNPNRRNPPPICLSIVGTKEGMHRPFHSCFRATRQASGNASLDRTYHYTVPGPPAVGVVGYRSNGQTSSGPCSGAMTVQECVGQKGRVAVFGPVQGRIIQARCISGRRHRFVNVPVMRQTRYPFCIRWDSPRDRIPPTASRRFHQTRPSGSHRISEPGHLRSMHTRIGRGIGIAEQHGQVTGLTHLGRDIGCVVPQSGVPLRTER